MRLLFAFAGGSGHLTPLVPIADAAARAGHTVAFTGAPELIDRIVGFEAFPSGHAYPPPPTRQPLKAVDRAQEDADLRDGFADRMARGRFPAIVALCRSWRPDVVVCDEADFGALLAAEACGVPSASVIVMPSGTFARPELLADTLRTVRADLGLGPSPAGPRLVLSPAPPSFRDPARPLPAGALSIRPFDPPARPGETAPAGPLVYVTLGTIFNMESGDLFPRVLAGVAALDIDVLVTVGPHLDPAAFASPGQRVHIAQWVSQSLVLPRCVAMVSHGGSGSTMGALAHGVPSVLLPMGADQPHNADRCAALGVAEVLDAVTATPAEVATAVRRVLDDDRYRRAAGAMRAEIAALPGPEHAIPALERLAG